MKETRLMTMMMDSSITNWNWISNACWNLKCYGPLRRLTSRPKTQFTVFPLSSKHFMISTLTFKHGAVVRKVEAVLGFTRNQRLLSRKENFSISLIYCMSAFRIWISFSKMIVSSTTNRSKTSFMSRR
jgi:hypothetical protein